MLDTTPANLIRERDAAITLRNIHMRTLARAVNIQTGPHSHAASSEYWPDNFVYQYTSLMLPKAGFNNPKVRIKSAHSAPERLIRGLKERMEMEQANVLTGMSSNPLQSLMVMQQTQSLLEMATYYNRVASAMEYGVNRWIVQTNARDTLIDVINDQLFLYGILKTTQEEVYGTVMPKWTRVPQKRYWFDPLCLVFDRARYGGEDIIRDKKDVIAEAEANPEGGWNMQAIASLATDAKSEEVRGISKTPELQRGEIVYCEMWTPESLPESYGPDMGFNGTIYTFSPENNGEWLREPRPYYGPPCGPHTMFGVYPVIDSPFPLSPIMGNFAQAEDNNLQVKAAAASAKSYKRIVFVPAGAPDVQKAVQDAPHDFIIPVKGLKKDEVIEVEVGGITDQQIQQIAMSRENLRRSSGMSDPMTGDAQAGVTATADAIQDESAGTRMAFVQMRAASAAERALNSVAWFLYHDGRSEIALDEEAGDELDMLWPTFVGGVQQGEKAEYHKLSLQVDLMSMPRNDQTLQQANTLKLFEMAITAAPIMPTAPHVDWVSLMDRLGDAFNESDFGEIVDASVLDQQVQMQQQQAMMESQPEQANPDEEARASEESSAKVEAQRSDIKNKQMVAKSTVKKNEAQAKAALQKGVSRGAKSGGARKR